MVQQLNYEDLKKILQIGNIEQASLSELQTLFEEEEGISDFIPDGICQIDPRNGTLVAYNSARAKRPHDNRPSGQPASQSSQECIICQGKTTGVVDVADLSEGFTFINKNLFPVLFPGQKHASEATSPGDETAGQVQTLTAVPGFEARPNIGPNFWEYQLGPGGIGVHGFHFLQWTSSHHDKDWHNMPLGDRIVVLNRLAALERTLLTEAAGRMPANQSWGDEAGRYGYVSIFKNYGHLVGGSLAHGHQQIGFSNLMPAHFHDNWRFELERGEKFSAYLLRENPAELLLRDYGPAVLLVPYFMRRPFDMMLVLKDAGKRYLHELTEVETAAVAEGWHEAIRVIRGIMPEIGRETAYNVLTNNGPGAGLYFEFLPYTQEIGGFEHIGLFICQQNPANVAKRIGQFLEQSLTV